MRICKRKLFIFASFLGLMGVCAYGYLSWIPSARTLSKEEHLWMDPFLRRFMLEENAIYTLVGSKPLTSFSLFYGDEGAQEEGTLTFEQLWDRWEKIRDRYPINKKFLLVKKEWKGDWKTYFPEYKACYKIYFINILQTAFVIQENYEVFKQVVGCDFDPLQLVLDFEKDPDFFWEKIATPEYCYLWGLLYGYGKQNAYSFLWKNRHLIGLERSAEEKLLSPHIQKMFSREKQHFIGRIRECFTPNFPIPIFASFAQDDPVIKKYIAERDQIKRLYKGKDFVDFTLQLLTDVNL